MLRRDIACKRQENKVLVKTVKCLQTKNGNYDKQVSQLSLTVDNFIVSNKKDIHRISVLEENVADKKSTIVKLSQDLESMKIDHASELENLMSSLQEVVDLNGALQAQVNQVNTTNEDIEEKNAELLDVVESLTKSLNDERSMHEGKIEEMMILADTEKENNAIIVHELEDAHKDITAQLTAQMSVLADDVAAKKSMIDEMSMDIHKWSSTCEKKVAENAELSKQLELSKTESDGLKVTVQGLESKNTELENLVCSLQEVVELNGELQARVNEVSAANDELGGVINAKEEKNAELLDIVESLTKSLNNEKSSHEREIEETKNLMETEKEIYAVSIRKLEAEMSTQKQSLEADIANLVKSLNEAMAENAELNDLLKLSKTESDGLKVTVQGLESKNTELENLVCSLQEVAELNGELQARVNEVSAANDELGGVINAKEEENAELLDIVESLTKSLNNEKSSHEREIEETKNLMETEKEIYAVSIRKLEAEMSTQKESLEADIANLVKSLNEAMAENAELNDQLKLSKTESDGLKVTVQGLESKNTNYATELENLMSSLQEVVELNGELQARVEEVSAANDELGGAINANEEKNAELLDIVENLTKSLNDEKSSHKREIEEANNLAETEKENYVVTIQKLEAEMSTQKESLEADIANLAKSLNEAMVYRRDVSCQNKQIQTMMEEMKKSTTKANEDLLAAIQQLEKDIEEEFQVTTQLKNGTKKLVMKLGDDKNSHYVDVVEDLLGNVRMIQCYQLSHFQIMNELVTKNRDQVKSIQLLPTFCS
jgi:chromosome segregation ATPase